MTALLDDLDREWDALRRRPAFGDELVQFIRRHPPLGSLADGTSTPRLDRDQADEILHALLAAHARGSRVAGRTVLQCMLPAVRAIVRRSRRHYPEVGDLEAETATAMWDAIVSYDLTVSTRVAARLQGWTLTRVVGDRAPHANGRRASRAKCPAEVATETEVLDLLQAPDVADPTAWAHHALTGVSLGPTGEVLDVIAWGVDAGAINAADAALLTRLYAPDPDLPEYAELDACRGAYRRRVARELGMSYPALRQRSCRAVRRLADAVRASRADG